MLSISSELEKAITTTSKYRSGQEQISLSRLSGRCLVHTSLCAERKAGKARGPRAINVIWGGL